MAVTILLLPLSFMSSAYHFGEDKWKFALCILLLFMPPILFFEYALKTKLPRLNLLRIVILSGLMLLSEVLFYYLPANMSQFYFEGGAFSMAVFTLFVLPAGAATGKLFKRKNKLVIVQKEI